MKPTTQIILLIEVIDMIQISRPNECGEGRTAGRVEQE